MTIWRYAAVLPDIPPSAQLTLGEGDTPLVRSRKIGPSVGLHNLYLKLEGCNPTGSYKDRFAVTAVSAMVARGRTACLATSSGNTGAALAAYCAAAGITCHIAIVETAPMGKLRQMMAYGANIFKIRQFGLRADVTLQVMEKLQTLSDRGKAELQISAFRYSPVGMQGVRTLALELHDQLQGRLDHVFAPAGGGGLVAALGQVWNPSARAISTPHPPAIHCVQPEGNATIAGPLQEYRLAPRPCARPQARAVTCTSTISGLQVPNVIDGDLAIEACLETAGTGWTVSDAEIFEAQRRLAREEGVFTEPAGAAALAGVLAARRAGFLQDQESVAALVTGIGFKDEPAIERMAGDRDCPLLDDAAQIDEIVSRAPPVHDH